MKVKPKTKNKKSKIKPKHKVLKKARKIKAVKSRTEKPVKGIFSKKALKKFKGLLIRQREKIVGEVEHIANDTLKKSQRDASGDLSGYTFHMADMATDHYDREFSLGIATSEQKAIYEVDEALKRIEDGTYGVCAICDKPISISRLKAVPYAKYCISCKQKEELMQKRGV